MESAVLTGQDVEPIAWSEARDRLANERFCWLATDKYGWPVVVEGGAFQAPYGAPTAGPPPYLVYEAFPYEWNEDFISRAGGVGAARRCEPLPGG